MDKGPFPYPTDIPPAGTPAPVDREKPAALVNGEPITFTELNQVLEGR